MALRKNKQALPMPAEHNPLKYPLEDDCFVNCSNMYMELQNNETPTSQNSLPALKLIPSNSNSSNTN